MEGATLLAAGAAGALLLCALASPLLRGFLYGVTTLHPLSLTATTAVLVATASFASRVPGSRAGRVNPEVALRAE